MQAGGAEADDKRRCGEQQKTEDEQQQTAKNVSITAAEEEKADVGECVCFFFSSRRRHTRFDCDWSSDVCSSDLASSGHVGKWVVLRERWPELAQALVAMPSAMKELEVHAMNEPGFARALQAVSQIGRASCRERG